MVQCIEAVLIHNHTSDGIGLFTHPHIMNIHSYIKSYMNPKNLSDASMSKRSQKLRSQPNTVLCPTEGDLAIETPRSCHYTVPIDRTEWSQRVGVCYALQRAIFPSRLPAPVTIQWTSTEHSDRSESVCVFSLRCSPWLSMSYMYKTPSFDPTQTWTQTNVPYHFYKTWCLSNTGNLQWVRV